jgi:predicted polyphosphate/ATP-dependent NAD kinase
MLKIGFVLNPIAGIGGPLAMKGSDHLSNVLLSEHSGYSAQRADVFLKAFLACDPGIIQQIEWVCTEGVMGGDQLDQHQMDYTSIGRIASPTTSQDTIDSVKSFQKEKCNLIVFAGGDGTARDVLTGLGSDMATPVIGLPSGVKMHSGVFSVTPEATAKMIEAIVIGDMVNLDQGEVRDYVEGSAIQTQYYGEVIVPKSGRYLQHTKVGGKESEEIVVEEISAYVEQRFSDSNLLIGPGSTCEQIKETLGLPSERSSLLGFDLYMPGKPWVVDLSAMKIKRYLDDIDHVLISFTRGQGFLFGRGNQQLDTHILSHLSWPDQFVIVGARSKLSSLEGKPLLVDSGDLELNKRLSGLIEIVTGFEDKVLHRTDFQLEP